MRRVRKGWDYDRKYNDRIPLNSLSIPNRFGWDYETKQIIVYSGTITGLRISSVAGTAFIDACADLVPYADAAHQIEIYDASARMLRGVLKAQGVAETLNTDVLAGFDFTSGWAPTRATVIDLNSFISTGSAGQDAYLFKTSTFAAAGRLYKSALVATATAGTVTFDNGNGAAYCLNNATGYLTWGTNTSGVIKNVAAGNGSTTDVTTMTVQHVLTPSADGCTIQASKTDATENWGVVTSGFTYNPSYAVIVRKLR